jgi:hypothetical protein
MDLVLIHDALTMNAGHPAHYVDHPAFLIILTLKSWFVLLHHLGLLDEWTLPAIPKDAAGFDLAMTHAVRAGRVLVFLIAIACVAIFAGLSRSDISQPLEKMLTFADAGTSSAANSGNPLAAVVLLLEGVASVLRRYTFVPVPCPSPS